MKRPAAVAHRGESFRVIAGLALVVSIPLLGIHWLHTLVLNQHLDTLHFQHAAAGHRLWGGCGHGVTSNETPSLAVPAPLKALGPESHPANATVLLSYTNKAYSEWMLNWALHGQRLNASILVIALDAYVASLCVNHSIPHMTMDKAGGLAEKASGLADDNFRKDREGKFRAMGAVKTGLAAALLRTYHYAAVVMSDTDVAWLRDPHELLQQAPEADIMISTDCLNHEVEINGTININRCGHIPGSWHSYAFNTGVVLVRNTPAAIKTVQEWSTRLGSTNNKINGWVMTDQLTLNVIFKEKTGKFVSVDPAKGSRVIYAWGEQVKVFPLATLVIESGHNAFVRRLHESYNTVPYAIHATFQLKANLVGKLARFREAGLWLLDPPEYFTKGNFLTYENTVLEFVDAAAAAWEKASGKPMVHLHKHLLGAAYQRKVFAEAAAMAYTLNRTLVPAPFACWCDQDWAADVLGDCKIIGADTKLPYRCSSDYMINVDAIQGPMVPYFRFPGFLEDERVPLTVKRSVSRLMVYPSESLAAAMLRNSTHSLGAIPFGATDKHVKVAAEALYTSRVVQLGPLVPGVFGAFEKVEDVKQFNRRIVGVTAGVVWCCAAKEWDKGQWPYAIFKHADPTPFLPAAQLQGDGKKSWVPDAFISERPSYCEGNGNITAVNLAYTKYPQHPCNYTIKGVPLDAWNTTMRSILEGMKHALSSDNKRLW